MKKNFRELCSNYSLNKYNELCFKKLKKRNLRKNKNVIINRHLKKDIGDYKLLKITFKQDYLEDLKDLHIKKNHCSFKKLLNEYYVCGYTFKGITGISKKILKYCNTCSQKNTKLYKKEPTQQIIFKKLQERFLADITEIPYEIYGESQYRYLLNIIDHFEFSKRLF